METRDVLTYLEAKNQLRGRKLSYMMSLAIVCLYILLRALGFDAMYMDVLAGGALIGSITANAEFLSWRTVTKVDLLAIIERQISRDPEALKLLAMHEAAC